MGEEWADMLEEGYEPEMGDAVVNAALRNTANILTGQAGEAPIHGQEFPQEKLGYSYKAVESFDSSVTAARDRVRSSFATQMWHVSASPTWDVVELRRKGLVRAEEERMNPFAGVDGVLLSEQVSECCQELLQ